MTTPPALASLAGLSVATEREYVSGFPVVIAVELVAPPAERLVLPAAGWDGTHGVLGARLADAATGALAVDFRPNTRRDAEEPPLEFELAPGEVRRTLVDASETFAAPLAPARYHAAVAYDGAWSQPFVLDVRAPADAERASLDRADRPPEQAWADWALMPGDAPADFPTSADDPLRWHRALRALMYGPTDLARLTRAALAPLDGLYEPEREAIWAEALLARGDASGFAAQAALVAQQWPGLAWWMREAAAGAGPVASMRDALQAVANG